MPLSRWAQRSARVVALGAAALGLGPRAASQTSPPAPAPLATAPAALDGTDAVALALRVADDDTDIINAVTINTINTAAIAADAVGRLTAKGARPADPGRGTADPSPAALARSRATGPRNTAPIRRPSPGTTEDRGIMRAHVRTWSVNDFFREDYAPDDPMDDEAAIRLMVGPVGRLGEEPVTVTVSTPTRLGRTLTSWGCPVFGRHRVIVEPMSVGPVIRYLTARVEALRADTWDELGAGLSRIGRWELEDYQDKSGPDDVHSPWRRAELRSWAVIRAHPEAGPVAPAEGQRLWLRLRIGPAGESDSEPLPFDVCVCEPAWLSRQIREHGPLVDGADHLFVRDLNLRDVTAFLSRYIAGKVGHWSRVTERLARVFEPATAPTA